MLRAIKNHCMYLLERYIRNWNISEKKIKASNQITTFLAVNLDAFDYKTFSSIHTGNYSHADGQYRDRSNKENFFG